MSKGGLNSVVSAGNAHERSAALVGNAVAGLAGIGAVAVVAMGFAQPAQAQSFQEQVDEIVFPDGCGSSGPPGSGCGSVGAAGGVGGQVEVQQGGLPAAVEQRMREAQCAADKNASCVQPGGAAADTMPFEGLNLFVSTDYQKKLYDGAAEADFDSDRAGFTVGLDSPMSWGLIGGALSYNYTTGDFRHNGGDFQQNSFGGLVYGSYYPSDASFIDAVVGLAGKGYELDRTVVALGNVLDARAKGDTLGFEFQSSVSGGYDFTFDNFTIGPRAGIHYLRTELNDFSESGTAMALHYEDQVEDSLTTTVGFQGSVAISTSFGVVVPQVNAEYVHEFLNDRRNVHATDITGTAFTFQTDPPDRNYFNIGGGVVFVLPDGISPFLNYTAEVANRFEEVHTVTAGVRLEM
jgi:outer membrane autotransporter protein